jgi:hypothetical protein
LLISAFTHRIRNDLFRFFRINDPYRLLAAFALLLIGRILYAFLGLGITLPEYSWLLIGERLGDGFVMYRDIYDHTGPMSTLTYRVLDYFFGRSVGTHRVLSFLLICFNASIFSLQLVRSKAFVENNYLPGLFYVLVSLSIPEAGSLSPMLMSSTFILLALTHVIRRVDNEASDELFLYAGLYLGIAVLFYLPAITFFFILLLSLIIFSSAIPRRVLLYIYGLTVPFILAIANFYWYDAFDYFIEQYFIGGLSLSRRWIVSWSEFFFISAVLIFWLAYSLIQVLSKGRYGNYETKIFQIMLLVSVAAVFSVLLDVSLLPAHLYLFIPTLVFLLTHLTLLIKKRFFRYTIPFLIVVSLVLNPYIVETYVDFSGYQLTPEKISGINKAKIMVLADNPERYYVGQYFCGPFLNSELARERMKYLDYYEPAYQIYSSIERDMPKVIIDDWQLMPAIFDRFPILADRYRPGTNNRYYLIED